MDDGVVVKDDPVRPWKAIAAAVVAEATYLLGQQVWELPIWTMLLLNMILVFGVTYAVANPKVVEVVE